MSLGNGTRFMRLNDDATPVLEDIAGIAVELGNFSMSRDTAEDTKYSNESSFKEYYGVLRDAGESNIKLEFDRAEAHHTKLLADFNSDNVRQFGFQWPDTAKTQVLCNGLITSYEVSHGTGEKLYVNAVIKWSGAPAWGVYV